MELNPVESYGYSNRSVSCTAKLSANDRFCAAHTISVRMLEKDATAFQMYKPGTLKSIKTGFMTTFRAEKIPERKLKTRARTRKKRVVM